MVALVRLSDDEATHTEDGHGKKDNKQTEFGRGAGRG